MEIDENLTIGAIAAARPEATRVFERLGIDYCCGGQKKLGEVVAAKGLSLQQVLEALGTEQGTAEVVDWTIAPLRMLTSYIVGKHHAFESEELGRLTKLLAKVTGVHGARHPELEKLSAIFAVFREELLAHMAKEERILFPAIERLDVLGVGAPPAPFGEMSNPVRMMNADHESAGAQVAEMRRLTDGFRAPADSCVSYRTLFDALATFELDLHQHMHLESNVLFPRAVELDTCARAGG